MQTFGTSKKFISWAKLLFGNASAVVNPKNIFKIERGVRQGCPLAPYFFLIVGEILTHIIKKTISEGRLRRITLLGWQINKVLGIGRRKETYLNYLEPRLDLTSIPPTLINSSTRRYLRSLTIGARSLTSIVVTCNHILLSTLWFFNTVGGGSLK